MYHKLQVVRKSQLRFTDTPILLSFTLRFSTHHLPPTHYHPGQQCDDINTNNALSLSASLLSLFFVALPLSPPVFPTPPRQRQGNGHNKNNASSILLYNPVRSFSPQHLLTFHISCNLFFLLHHTVFLCLRSFSHSPLHVWTTAASAPNTLQARNQET